LEGWRFFLAFTGQIEDNRKNMSVLHELPLVSTIAVGLGMAFVCGFVASKLRLSPLVGYLLAGVIIGPHSPGFTADLAIAEQLSEIGVVLLLFGVGLHFSIQDFMEVRKIASFGAVTRILLVMAGGVGMAHFMGWSMGTGLIFGLAISVASTVVMLRALEDHHLLQTITGKISIGWLVVEDIAMVLAMVMIPALAAGAKTDAAQTAMGMQLITAFAKMGLFAAIMVIVGKRVLPWLLTAVSRTGSRELFTLAAISMAMGIAFGAAILFGVSLALGAFFAGMMIRESDLNHEVADRVLPFQDAFAVLFFVAVGMLFDPSVLLEQPVQVTITVLLIIGAKFIVTYGIVRMFRYPKKTSLLIAIGLAQIGEFSFILIALGMSAGLIDAEIRNLVLAGALLSIALNPILFGWVRDWCVRRGLSQISESDALAHLENEERKALKNFIVLIGAGQVGKNITKLLDASAYDLVVIDENREIVEKLRKKEFHAIAGDATEQDILLEAQIEKADTVMITLPDPFDTRRIVDLVRQIKPDVRIFVRSHNNEETEYFKSQNVELTVIPTEEVARRMVEKLAPAA